jgi:hypothetical protein
VAEAMARVESRGGKEMAVQHSARSTKALPKTTKKKICLDRKGPVLLAKS